MDDTDSHKIPQGTSEGNKKVPKTPKMTPKDLVILNNYDPNLSQYQNLKKLSDSNQIDLGHGYQRLKKCEYLKLDIELIKTHHREFLVREAVPKASKAIMEVLDAKKPKKIIALNQDGNAITDSQGKPVEIMTDGLTPLQKMPAVKLVYDKYYGQEPPQTGSGNTFINILSKHCEIQTYGKPKPKVGEEEDK